MRALRGQFGYRCRGARGGGRGHHRHGSSVAAVPFAAPPGAASIVAGTVHAPADAVDAGDELLWSAPAGAAGAKEAAAAAATP